ncbi:YHYH protein [Sanguibacter antarcticus]|uniref:YHYH protein n=1 Tax=Sanguibacter antarcticus TaxID=372484 RepID=A0A2A9E5W5_9MICO|nr:YHYH protein [Sanguibacter antarcticus]PFG34457.1 YHYH protein [Sanguibacter antarcticus]
MRLCSSVLVGGALLSLVLAACGSTDSEDSTATSTATSTSETTDDSTAATAGVDTALFFDGALAGEATTEDCTLNGGAETSCYSITVAGYPTSHDVGPFCPDTITDGADAGGLWFDGDAVYDLDGEFIANLDELYGDDTWHMYDEDGNVLSTDTAEEFEAAARPDVDPALANHCVQGALEWLENGEPITTTVLIPVTPVLADAPAAPAGNLGVTLDGVVIAESAPVDAILGAYTIAAFDDCGAHFNPFEGYHMHDATAEAAGLDECNGHTTEEAGYHYHANSAEKNQVIECFVGQSVAGDEAGGGGPPPGR